VQFQQSNDRGPTLLTARPPGSARYDNKENELLSAQLVSGVSLIWHDVATVKKHLQAACITHIHGTVYSFIEF
jgi:hypothetical protein